MQTRSSIRKYDECKLYVARLTALALEVLLCYDALAYANAIILDKTPPWKLRDAVATLVSVEKGLARVMGAHHPEMRNLEAMLKEAREKLVARESASSEHESAAAA